ncbi:NAD-dependent epimerase/dehydratase [Hymenobacter roseosalivarius DSM 11622]|uniref:NAD-dependent epimerase/dehydratase n=1 Tax=Hymenobacter roseosalivarius DSM 11622 TaxID=645990 RepID=A0A1W1VY83_9BACT|nr:NAD-dependent epimerase/dehydratase family protein [Hymenobacter roseosalivarius]SMB98210.1 NAD-dependent epimerase/dehydratase [Hymenobacter roseosalivarius DSM 11622]
MQTILGAGGTITREVAHHLPTLTDEPLRLVSRRPQKVNAADELHPADLTDATQTKQAVAGSSVAYLVAGLRYNTKTWQRDWPRIMTNVLNACEHHGSKLVFFDNVYMYGLVGGKMTEETPFNPVSKKGEVRARIARQLLEAIKSGRVESLIARAPDFYGPGINNSLPNALIFDNFKKGKAAQWPGSVDEPHSYIFTPDAGRATAVLGITPSAYGQTWHLPTAAPAITTRQFASLAAVHYGVAPKISGLPKWLMRAVGLFVEPVRESVEMLYQYDRPYFFDSSKFDKQFFAATPYAEGIRLAVV